MEGIYKKDNSYKNVKKKSVTHVDYSGERGVLHFYGIIYIFLIFMRKLTPSFFKAKKCMCWQCIVYRKRRSQDLWTIPPQRIRNLRRDKVCIWDLFVFCLSCFCLVLCCVCVCVCLFCFCCCCLFWKAGLWKTILHVHDWINHWNILVNFSTIIILK